MTRRKYFKILGPATLLEGAHFSFLSQIPTSQINLGVWVLGVQIGDTCCPVVKSCNSDPYEYKIRKLQDTWNKFMNQVSKSQINGWGILIQSCKIHSQDDWGHSWIWGWVATCNGVSKHPG